MSEPPTIFQVPEPIYVSLLVSWIVMCLISFGCGYFKGRSDEVRYRMK